MPTQMPTLTLAMWDISRAATVSPFSTRQIWYMRGYDEQVIDFILRDGRVGQGKVRLQPEIALRAKLKKGGQVFQIDFMQFPLKTRQAGASEQTFAEKIDERIGPAGEKHFQGLNHFRPGGASIQIENNAIESPGSKEHRRKFGPERFLLPGPERARPPAPACA